AVTHSRAPMNDQSVFNQWYAGLPFSNYLYWKLAFTACSFAAIWLAYRLTNWQRRAFLFAISIATISFVEPYILVRNWWAEFVVPAQRLTSPAPLTSYLQKFPSEQNRVYTRFDFFEDQTAANASVDAPNVTAIYGLHNVAGYEPLVLSRYSRALGDVG